MRPTPSFRGGRSSVKPPAAKPPGPGPMFGSSKPSMPSQTTMGGPTPNMQPPAGKSAMMAPSKPQATRMYADGGMPDGMGMPDPVGGAGAPPVGGDQPDPAAAMPPMPSIRPDSVNYHDDEQECQLCSYFSAPHCSVLQMEVSEKGGCNAFLGSGAQGDDGDQGNQPGEDDNDTAAGTSGSPLG